MRQHVDGIVENMRVTVIAANVTAKVPVRVWKSRLDTLRHLLFGQQERKMFGFTSRIRVMDVDKRNWVLQLKLGY
jgi:hypothetical protein